MDEWVLIVFVAGEPIYYFWFSAVNFANWKIFLYGTLCPVTLITNSNRVLRTAHGWHKMFLKWRFHSDF